MSVFGRLVVGISPGGQARPQMMLARSVCMGECGASWRKGVYTVAAMRTWVELKRGPPPISCGRLLMSAFWATPCWPTD